MAGMTLESRHLSVHIDRPFEEVYDFAADPANLPIWSTGLGTSIEQVEGEWVVDTGSERLGFAFAPRNDFGVLDHYVTFPSGQTFYNPMRVFADETGCEAVFSLRRQPEMSDADFERDAATVTADLVKLKQVLESAD